MFWLVNYIRINMTNIITKYLAKPQIIHILCYALSELICVVVVVVPGHMPKKAQLPQAIGQGEENLLQLGTRHS